MTPGGVPDGPLSISSADVDALAAGAALLGSGGGGATETAARWLREQLRNAPPVSVVDSVELDTAAPVIPVGVIGATSVYTEMLASGRELADAIRRLAGAHGVRPSALMPIEIGGHNALTALSAAHVTGLPVVDADLMGRALPRLDQFSLVAAGFPMTPLVLVTTSGQSVVLDGASAERTERVVRAMLAASEGWAALALPPLRAGDVPAAALPNTLRRALALGRTHLRYAPSGRPDVVAEALGARLLCAGRVLDVSRRPEQGGYGRGSVAVTGVNGSGLLRLEMENEYLLALLDGEPVATTPDIICLLDRRSGVPLLCEQVRQGLEVYALHLASPAFWRHPDHLAVVGPEAFGLHCVPRLLPDNIRQAEARS